MSQPRGGEALGAGSPGGKGQTLGGALPHRQLDPDPARVRVRRRKEGEEGYRLDAFASARRWRLELQLSREESEAQQLHVDNRTTLGLRGDSTYKVDAEDETVRRAGQIERASCRGSVNMAVVMSTFRA